MASQPHQEPTTLIIGAGILGTSTAYYLSKSASPSSITIVDRHAFPAPAAASSSPPYGASHDINKIVRADYSVPFYMALGYEAIASWSSWDLIKPYYHRTGWIMLDTEGSDLAQRIRKNFKESGHEDTTKDLDFEQVKSEWGGVLKDIDTAGLGNAYSNPGAGWAEADKAVAAILAEAVNNGVRYHQGDVRELLLNDNNEDIKGVKLDDGSILTADRIVLATGAWSSQLMTTVEDTLQMEETERLEAQVMAGGVCCAFFDITDEEKKRLDQMPVVIYGDTGELQPPPSKLLKCVNARSVANTIVTSSGRQISAPPPGPQNIVPESLRAETLAIANKIMPSISADGRDVAFWRICWDLITPEQHQLITKHPHKKLKNLYLAIGGSFHSWKFLPTIGKYVANVIQGISNGPEKDKNWAWKKAGWASPRQRGAHEKVIPTRELRDLAN